MKRVYIGACGLGLGHVGRMMPVAEALREEGIDVVFSTYGNAYHYTVRRGFKTHPSAKIPWPEDGNAGFDVSKGLALLMPIGFNVLRQAVTEKKLIRKLRPDLVISDTRYTTLAAMWGLRTPTIFVTNLLRTAPLDVPSRTLREGIETASYVINRRFVSAESVSRVVVPDMPQPYTVSANGIELPKSMDDLLQYIGFIVEKRPEELPPKEDIKSEMGLDGRPLIYVAISGPGSAKAMVSEAISDALWDFDAQTVMSLGDLKGGLDRRRGNVRVMSWVPDRFRLLKAADLVVTRPGLTTIGELLTYGKPGILIPTPHQPEQITNAKGVEALGAGRVLDQNDLGRETLAKCVGEALTDHALRDMAASLAGMIRAHDGRENLKSMVMEMLD